jgi:antitoxin YefM
MTVTSVSDLRKNAKKYLDYVVDEDDILVIPRKKGKSVVMIDMERFSEGMDTTAYLMSSKANREHLERGMANVREGKTFKVDLEELKKNE